MEDDVKIIEIFVTLLVITGLIAIGLGWEIITTLLPIIAIIISGLTFYYSRKVTEAEVGIIKDDIEGVFFVGYSGGDEIAGSNGTYIKTEKKYIGGSLRFTLTFYNKGDRMSIVKVKEITLPDLNKSASPYDSVTLQNNFSIPPHSHYLYNPADVYFSANGEDIPPTEIKIIKITYTWTKKEETQSTSEEIPISCEILR